MKGELFIITNNFKLVYKIQSVLGTEYVIHHHSKLNGKLTQATFIITSPSERSKFPHYNMLLISPDLPLLRMKNLILSKLQESYTPTIIVGIDPGHTIGIAILQDMHVLCTSAFYALENLVLWLKQRLHELTYGGIVVKIGDGDPKIRDEIIDRLKKEAFHQICLVNEENTSVRLFGHTTRHETAAILIANREGLLI